MLIFLPLLVVRSEKSKLGDIDEEISLKTKLFGDINGKKRYDSEVIQNRWRKTVESDIKNIG